MPSAEVRILSEPLAWVQLPTLFPEFADPDRWVGLLQRHWMLVEAATPAVKVTSVPTNEAVRRHYAECLEIWRLALASGHDGGPLIDIGSGGGFPGMVVAVLRPDMEVHLVEPTRKRARLLGEMRDTLGLANVEVHAQRAEETGRGPLREHGSLVTARAVAELRVLLEYAAPLAAYGAKLVFPRGSGSRAADDEAVASGVDRMTGCGLLSAEPMRPEISENLAVLTFVKDGPTPESLPRRPGLAAAHPLNGSNA